MAKYSFNAPVINLMTGKPFIKQVNADVTVRDAVIEALVNYKGEPTGAEKLLRGALAEHIAQSKTPNLSADDVELIRKCVAEFSNVAAANAVDSALEHPLADEQPRH